MVLKIKRFFGIILGVIMLFIFFFFRMSRLLLFYCLLFDFVLDVLNLYRYIILFNKFNFLL